jgi:alcohol dehydrogenase class IV
MASSEHVEQFFPGVEYPIISYGLPFPQACAKHAIETLGCSKVYVICSGSLSRNTKFLERLEAALGKDHFVGVRKGMKPHTMFSELLEVAVDVEKSGADCIITIGGGSLVDAAKYIPFVSACSWNNFGQKP